MQRDEPRIELVYDQDCPNVEQARDAIRSALAEAGRAPGWTEWDRADPRTPATLRRYGSPTVLVGGRDICGHQPDATSIAANSCRVYVDGCGCLCGAPDPALILAAIRETAAA